MNKDSLNTWVLLSLVLFISAVFLSMISQFLMAIFLAGIFSALCYPLYRKLEKWFGSKRSLASIVTIFLIVTVVLIPLIGLLGIVTAQAVKVGETVRPWIEAQLRDPSDIFQKLQALPFYDKIEPYKNFIFQKAGAMVGTISGFLINRLSSVTLGTVNFIFMTLVLLYTMFFFLMDGGKLINLILYYLPLKDNDEQRILNKFTSVSRATLKGTLVIGILQGVLAGGAFAIAGIPSSVFWGTMMAVLSIIPGIGSALIWVPAVIVLAMAGSYLKATGLAVFCALVVGSMDNVLRPILVGKDTQMHELMIFFGTLGGIVMFGPVGIIVGPIIAALFTTIWDIYGVAFKDYLPAVPQARLNVLAPPPEDVSSKDPEESK